jgi:hypothetical protein
MKVINIPIFDMDIEVYENYKDFERDQEYTVTDEEGVCIGNAVWVKDAKAIGVIFHEASHLADFIIEERLDMEVSGLRSSTELRAYMLEWIGLEIIKCLAQ